VLRTAVEIYAPFPAEAVGREKREEIDRLSCDGSVVAPYHNRGGVNDLVKAPPSARSTGAKNRILEEYIL